MSSRNSLWLAAALVLAGCGSHSRSTARVTVIGDPSAPFATGSRLSAAGELVRGATDQGLVTLDAEGRVIPGLADRWIVTDGGLTYIFRLRDGSWPDGTRLTGESARTALHQALERIEGMPLALDLAGVADIRAMAGRVIEIRLTWPMPDFLQLLAQDELGLTRHGRGWGPMAPKREGKALLLTPIPPEKRGPIADDPSAAGLRAVNLAVEPGAGAVAAFTHGDTDVVLGGNWLDLPELAFAAPARGTVQFDPVTGLFGLLVTRTEGVLATPSGREAVAMSIDRNALAAAFASANWVPTTRIVAPGLDDTPGPVGERWSDMDLAARRALARRRIAQGAAAGQARPEIRIALPQGPGADAVFARLAEDFAAVGITALRARPGEAADMRMIDSVARYPRAAWFLNQLNCRVLHGPCSPEADALADRARAEADPAVAATLWVQAEQALTASNVYIPLGSPIRWSLVRRTIGGFAANRWGLHPLVALAGSARR